MNNQPNIVQVRNGSPRSRSRSVSRSRSRSASPSAEREPRGNPYDLPDKSPTSGEELAAKMAVRHLEKCGVAPTLREMSALGLPFLTGELLTKLTKQLEETGDDSVTLDEPLTASLSASIRKYPRRDSDQAPMRYISIDLNVPAAETGQETLPALRLGCLIRGVEFESSFLPVDYKW